MGESINVNTQIVYIDGFYNQKLKKSARQVGGLSDENSLLQLVGIPLRLMWNI